ncbi:MAG: hypothetical protein ACRC0Y_08860 [Fusobacteriaceae bacterium]
MSVLDQEVTYRPQATGVIPVAPIKNNTVNKTSILGTGLKIGTEIVDYLADRDNKEVHKQYNEALKEKERIEGVNRDISFTRTKDLIDKESADFENSLVDDDYLSEGNLHNRREQWKKGALDIVSKDGIMDVEQKEKLKSYISDSNLRTQMRIVAKSHSARKEKYKTDLFNDLEDKKISVGVDIYNGNQASANQKINSMKEQYKLLAKLDPNKYNKEWVNKQNSEMVIYAGMGVVNKAFKTSVDAYMENPTPEGYKNLEKEISSTQIRLADPEVLKQMFGSEHGLEYEEFLTKTSSLASRALSLARANGGAKLNGEKKQKEMKINDVQADARKAYAVQNGVSGDVDPINLSPEGNLLSEGYSTVNADYLQKQGISINSNQELFEYLESNPEAPKFTANLIGSEDLREMKVFLGNNDYKGLDSYLNTLYGTDRTESFDKILNEQIIKQTDGVLSAKKLEAIVGNGESETGEVLKSTIKAEYDPLTKGVYKDVNGSLETVIANDTDRTNMIGLAQMASSNENSSLLAKSLTDDVKKAYIANVTKTMTEKEIEKYNEMHSYEKERFISKKMQTKEVKEANKKTLGLLYDHHLGKGNRPVVFKGNTSILNSSINSDVISAQLSEVYFDGEKNKVYFKDSDGEKVITNGTMLKDSTSRVHFKNNKDGTAGVFFMNKPVFKKGKDGKEYPVVIDPEGKRVNGVTVEEALESLEQVKRNPELLDKKFEEMGIPLEFLNKENLTESVDADRKYDMEVKPLNYLDVAGKESIPSTKGDEDVKWNKSDETPDNRLGKVTIPSTEKEEKTSAPVLDIEEMNNTLGKNEKEILNPTREQEVKLDKFEGGKEAFKTFEKEYKVNSQEIKSAGLKSFISKNNLENAPDAIREEAIKNFNKGYDEKAFKTFEREYKISNIPTAENKTEIVEAVKEEIDLNTPEQSIRKETLNDVSNNLVTASEIMGIKAKKLVEAFKIGISQLNGKAEITPEEVKQVETNSILAVKKVVENNLENKLGIDFGNKTSSEATESNLSEVEGVDAVKIPELDADSFKGNLDALTKGAKKFIGEHIDNFTNDILSKDNGFEEILKNSKNSEGIEPIEYKNINKVQLGNNISDIMKTIKNSEGIEDPNIVVSKTKEIINSIKEKSAKSKVSAAKLTSVVSEKIQEGKNYEKTADETFASAREITKTDVPKIISTLKNGKEVMENTNGELVKAKVVKTNAQIQIDRIFDGATDTQRFKDIQNELSKEIEKYPKEMWEADTLDKWKEVLKENGTTVKIMRASDNWNGLGSFEAGKNLIRIYPNTRDIKDGKLSKRMVTALRHEYRHSLQRKFGEPYGNKGSKWYGTTLYEQDADIFAHGYDLSEYILDRLARDVTRYQWSRISRAKKKWFGLSDETYLPKSKGVADWDGALKGVRSHDYITNPTLRKPKEVK